MNEELTRYEHDVIPMAPGAKRMTEQEAKNHIFQTQKIEARATNSLLESCRMVLEWFDRGGHGRLPVKYFARVLDVSERHIYRRRRCALVLQQLKRHRMRDKLSFRICLELEKLVDHPDLLLESLEAAIQHAKAGKKPLASRHVCLQVNERLPDDELTENGPDDSAEGVTRVSHSDRQSPELPKVTQEPAGEKDRHKLWQGIAASNQLAGEINAPNELQLELTRVNSAAYAWWEQSKTGPELPYEDGQAAATS